VSPAAGIQGDLEQAVEHRGQRPRALTKRIGLTYLVEDLVLTQNSALQATRDADQVAGGGGILEPQTAGRKLRELALAESSRGDVELDPVTGVDQDDRIMGGQGFALGCKRLAGGAWHTPGVGDEGQHGGSRRLVRRL
jgi:hypothetical protein